MIGMLASRLLLPPLPLPPPRCELWLFLADLVPPPEIPGMLKPLPDLKWAI